MTSAAILGLSSHSLDMLYWVLSRTDWNRLGHSNEYDQPRGKQRVSWRMQPVTIEFGTNGFISFPCFFFQYVLYFMCMSVGIYLWATLCWVSAEVRRGESYALTAVTHRVGAGDVTRVLSKSNKWALSPVPISDFSSAISSQAQTHSPGTVPK